MGIGGATRLTAGSLEVGSGNTFDLADVTEFGVSRPFNHAWWTYTPTTRSTLVVDTFASDAVDIGEVDTMIEVYDGLTLVGGNDDSADAPDGAGGLSKVTMILNAGTTYHILAGTYGSDPEGLITYRLTVSVTPTPLTPIAGSYSIPGRPTAPAGGSEGSPATIGPNQVSAPTPRDSGAEAWWQITPDQDGRLSFDALLSYTSDGVRSTSYPRVVITLFQGVTTLTTSNQGYDPELANYVPRGQFAVDLSAGVTYLIRFDTPLVDPDVVMFLRVSDYAPTTGWIDTDDVQVITAPPDEMTWEAPLPDSEFYPGDDPPTILPTPVVGASGERYVKPYGLGYGFEGFAAMTHYPRFLGDPFYGVHPWELPYPTSWGAIWNRATQGHWTTAYDGGPDAGESSEHGFDADGYWDNNQLFPDWPVGYRAHSSAVDSAPPDGHQTIDYRVWAFHWHVKVTHFLHDYPGTNAIYPWVTSDIPGDQPGDHPDWELVWDADPSDPPTLKAIEAASNPATVDTIFSAGSNSDGFYWHVRGKTLSWAGDGDFENGYWYQDPDPDVPPPGDGGDIYRSVDIVGGDPEFSEFARHGYYGAGPIPWEGEVLAEWLADYNDWHTILDGEATIAEYLELEAPGLAGADHSPRTDVGELMLSAIPALYVNGQLPDNGFYNATYDHASFRVFVALRGTYARPRHRWTGDPVIPGVIGGGVIRQYPRDDNQGWGSATRLYPPTKANRIIGNIQ